MPTSFLLRIQIIYANHRAARALNTGIQMAANASTPPLPVLATVWTAYTLTYRGFGHFLQIAGRWLLLLFVFVFAIDWLLWPLGQSEVFSPALSWVFLLFRNFPILFIGAVIAVPWHRYLILGESKPNPFTSIDQTKLTYFVVAVVFSFATSIPFIPLAWVGNLIQSSATGLVLIHALFTLTAGVVILALAWRASLYLPGLALREHVDFGTVWLRTKGNTLRIGVGGILSILPFIIVLGLLFTVVNAGAATNASRIGGSLLGATTEVCHLLIGLSGLTFLTVAYRYFSPERSTGLEAE